MSVRAVVRVLEALGIPVALIGGHALAARGYPRFTADIDLLTTDLRVLDAGMWSRLMETGAAVDPRRGDADDPLAGVVHIQLADATDIDIVVGRWAWQREVVARSEPLEVMGVVLPVPRVSDLILLKLAAGGYLDRNDAAAAPRTCQTRRLTRCRRNHAGSPGLHGLCLADLASFGQPGLGTASTALRAANRQAAMGPLHRSRGGPEPLARPAGETGNRE
ncbi:MAG: hypothetical protein IT184_05135 [Acidobacteria bacterium]|nr:hypothetical protein [Acidobacteriota bacterium]